MATVPGSAGGYVSFVLDIFIRKELQNFRATYSIGETAVGNGAWREHALGVRLGERERAVVSRDVDILSAWHVGVLEENQIC